MRPETHSLYQTDALGLLERFDSGLFTLAYVDPPWATTESSETTLLAYRSFISKLVQQCWRVLNDKGTLYFHAPPVSHTDFRLILNQTFGRPPSSVIVWKYDRQMNQRRGIPDSHEEILRYVKTPQAVFNMIKTPPSASQYRLDDGVGPYRLMDLTMPGVRGGLTYAWSGKHPPEGRSWRFTLDQMQQYEADGRIVTREGGMPRLKQYFDESLGRDLGSVWDDIPPIPPTEKLYPSEKPPELCSRIIRQATNEGDWVLDPLCGSGQVLVQSQKLNRPWTGCDNASEAITASKKLFENSFAPTSSLLTVVTDESVASQPCVSTEYKDVFLDVPELDSARQRLAALVTLTASLKKELSGTPQSEEDVLAALFDMLPRLKWLVCEDGRTEAAAELDRRLTSFRSLEPDSRDFLITGFVTLQMLPEDMDSSVVSVSAWKAVENELNRKLLLPFRDWIVHTYGDLAPFLSELDASEWECAVLAAYLKKAKFPPLGQTRAILNKCATSKKTIQNSPSLKALKEYIQTHFADPESLLSPQGILSVLSQENIDLYRNGAAHTTVFTKERATESFEFIIQALAALLAGLKSTSNDSYSS